MGPELHQGVVINLDGERHLRPLEWTPVTLAALEKAFNGDLTAAVFRDRGGWTEVLGVIVVKRDVNELLRAFRRGDTDDLEWRLQGSESRTARD
jgi:hypothetical protein